MFQLCQQVDARGLPQGEWGLRLKQALPESQLRMGWLAHCFATSTWAWEVSEAPRDLLPTPVCSADFVETKILQAFAAGALPADIRRDFPNAVRRAARSASLFLLTLLVNFLHLGSSPKLQGPRAECYEAQAARLCTTPLQL